MSPKVPAAMLSRRGRKLSHFGNALRCDHSSRGFAATRNRIALDRLSHCRHHHCTAGDKLSHYEEPAPTHVWRKCAHAIVQHHAGRCRRSRIAPVRDRASYVSPPTPKRRGKSIDNTMRRGGPSVRYSVSACIRQEVIGGHGARSGLANAQQVFLAGHPTSGDIPGDCGLAYADHLGEFGLRYPVAAEKFGQLHG